MTSRIVDRRNGTIRNDKAIGYGLPVCDTPEGIEVEKPARYLCKISPEVARIWLALNRDNRRPRGALVRYIVRQIQSGEWREDHLAPIAFSSAGRLIDGQHRLFAIMESGETVRCEVRFGCDDSLREYIDTGISRTLEDRVTLVENQNQNRIAAQLVTGLFYGSAKSSDARPSPDDAREVFDKFKEPIIYLSENWKKAAKISLKPVMCALCEFWLRNGEQMMVAFYESLHTADGAVQQARILRDWLLRQENSAGGTRTKKVWRMTIGACRAYTEGREIKQVRESSWE